MIIIGWIPNLTSDIFLSKPFQSRNFTGLDDFLTQKTGLKLPTGKKITGSEIILDGYPVTEKYPNTQITGETFSNLDDQDCLVIYSLQSQGADFPFRITLFSHVTGSSSSMTRSGYEILCGVEIEKIDKKGLVFLKFLGLNPSNSQISNYSDDERKGFSRKIFSEIFQKIVKIYASDIFYNKILDDPINFFTYNNPKIFNISDYDQFCTERAIYWILNDYLTSVNTFSKYMDPQDSQDPSVIFALMKYRRTMRGISIYALHFVNSYSSWISKPKAEYYTKIFTDIGIVTNTFYDEANEKYSLIKTERMFSIQMALALLEIIIIFYYSLGIWDYLVDETTWAHIPILWKAVIGLGLAILLTYGSHLVVSKERRLGRLIFCVTGIIILTAAAVFLTYYL